jgi:hypothetical protein
MSGSRPFSHASSFLTVSLYYLIHSRSVFRSLISASHLPLQATTPFRPNNSHLQCTMGPCRILRTSAHTPQLPLPMVLIPSTLYQTLRSRAQSLHLLIYSQVPPHLSTILWVTHIHTLGLICSVTAPLSSSVASHSADPIPHLTYDRWQRNLLPVISFQMRLRPGIGNNGAAHVMASPPTYRL